MNTYQITLSNGKSFEIDRKNIMDATTSAVSMTYFLHNGAEIVKIERVNAHVV